MGSFRSKNITGELLPPEALNVDPRSVIPLLDETLGASVVICTRNRGGRVVPTIQTVLENQRPTFEVILIDQSTNEETATAIAPFLTDPRFRYIRSNTVGTGRSRNIGLAESRAGIVVYTDDDCMVPAHWVQTMAELFRHEGVGMAFCNVVPADFDPSMGFIPTYVIEADFVATSILDKCRARGIGAGMAVKRKTALSIGGFDEMLGPGATFPANEEGDLAVRMLLNGWQVYETSRVAVVHDGFRTWQQGKALTRRNWIGVGAAYAKPIKLGKWQFAVVVLHEGFVQTFWKALSRLFAGKRPKGIRSFIYFWIGFSLGLKTPVDPQRMVFVES